MIKEVVAIGHTWLAVLAVIFSVIGAYYYLRVVKLMYFDKADTAPEVGTDLEVRMLVSLTGLAVLALGLAPGELIRICTAVLGF